MRLRPYFGSLLSLAIAFGLMVGIPSTASAQLQPWTTVGSAGTMDDNTLKVVTLDGSTAVLAGFQRGGVTIRYNVVAVNGLFGSPSIFMLVRYRATPDPIVFGRADSQVVVKLIEVNLNTGLTTTKLVFDSNKFPASNDFQTQSVSTCPALSMFDFGSNAYYIEVQLGKRQPFSGSPGIQAIQVSAFNCNPIG